jgi:hypothetical protein
VTTRCKITTDKIKSKKNDWKAHDDFLEGMITSFWGKKLILTLRLTTPLLKTSRFQSFDSVTLQSKCRSNDIFALKKSMNHVRS